MDCCWTSSGVEQPAWGREAEAHRPLTGPEGRLAPWNGNREAAPSCLAAAGRGELGRGGGGKQTEWRPTEGWLR